MQISDIVLFGTNHKIAPLELREQTALSEIICFQGMGHLPATGQIAEILIYSTCNRLEFLYITHDKDQAKALVTHFLRVHSGLSDVEIAKYFYTKTGLDAVRHLFRVTSSLDSMVVGEPQILGQIKKAYEMSRQARSTGVILNRLLHKAFFTAKKVRHETEIGNHAVSISHAAVELAQNLLTDLGRCNVLLIGAGTMGTLAAHKIARYQPRAFFIANRTYDRALTLATELACQAVAWKDLRSVLADVDLIISAAACDSYLLDPDNLPGRSRSLVIIDIGLPRSVAPEINNLPNCTVHDLDSLQTVVAHNQALRHRAAAAAEVIVQHEAAIFAEWMKGFALKPTLLAARSKLHATVLQELSLADISLDDEMAELLAKRIVNRFWHNPGQHLKKLSHEASKAHYLDLMRKLFDLDI